MHTINQIFRSYMMLDRLAFQLGYASVADEASNSITYFSMTSDFRKVGEYRKNDKRGYLEIPFDKLEAA